MDEKQTGSDLWKRKFKPITDWRPAGGMSGWASGSRALLEDALEGLGKGKDALAKKLEPLGEEAKIKIKDSIKVMEDVASKSSVEAR